jgi:hypothetical protein
MEFALQHLTQCKAEIESIYQERNEKAHDDFLGPWMNDTILTHNLENLKKCAERVSHSCTKFSILILNTTSTDTHVLQSFLDEFDSHVTSFMEFYVAISNNPISWPLFNSITVQVRNQIGHIYDLFECAIFKKNDALPSTTGMIWKINEDMQKLPMSNKLAYRRYIMELINRIKETIKEFTEYVDEADEIHQAEAVTIESLQSRRNRDHDEERLDEDEEDIDSKDSDDQPYTVGEAAVCKECIALMNCIMQALKTTLIISTKTLDAIPIEDFITIKYSEIWIAKLTTTCLKMRSKLMDLCAELFRPFDQRLIAAGFADSKAVVFCIVSALRDEGIKRYTPLELLPGIFDLEEICKACTFSE